MSSIDTSFQTLTEDVALDEVGAIAACEEIADSIDGTAWWDWMKLVRSHHAGTFEHCMLITGLASTFTTKIGTSHEEIVKITMAGLLHDIGKANVPAAILDKPSALTLREINILRRYPSAGYDYLMQNSTVAADILSAVQYYHEYLDGSGYPDKLKERPHRQYDAHHHRLRRLCCPD
ncbi:MAG: HD domain-containing protein [Candidatus Devosia symbiotica]|nr:HD domain-containing protein [Candidatus Devosia symbiotica]